MKKIIVTVIVAGFFIATILTLKNNKAAAEKAIIVEDISAKVIPVSTAIVERRDIEQNLSLIGTILPKSDINIVSEAAGRLVALNANVGDYKSAGSVIAEIDSELRKATLLNAQAMYEKAQSDADRIELLYKENAATLVQLEQVKFSLQAAQAQLIIAKRQVKDTKIITPINGVISMKMVDKGAIIGMNAVIANIIDISSLKVKVNVSERDAFTLKKADKVNISTDVYPGKTFIGTVAYISSKADEAHTYPVEISLANSSITPLKAGMFARITFSTIYKHQILTIPRNALLGSIKDPKVFITNGNKAELRKLIIGAENGYNIEILGGLQAGDIIIVDGQNNLKDGTKISVVNH